MADIRLIFTLDYEIFGDGSGSPEREQVIPTAHLANILELHDMRLTIFMEVGQQIYFRKHGMDAHFMPVEEQIRLLAARGHDVQLHIHPMWFFAPPPDRGRPTLDAALFDLSMLEPSAIEDIVAESCAYLVGLVSPVVPGYRPVAHRAGAWSMRRHHKLFEILARNGILIDSTIAPGARLEAGYGSFDFTRYPMIPSWQEAGLLELPILTERTPFAARRQINMFGMASRQITRRFYPTKLTEAGRSKLGSLREILARDYVMADFNTLSARALAGMIERHARTHADLEGPLPVVMIGHSKISYFADRLHLLLEELHRKGCAVRGATLRGLAAERMVSGLSSEPAPALSDD